MHNRPVIFYCSSSFLSLFNKPVPKPPEHVTFHFDPAELTPPPPKLKHYKILPKPVWPHVTFHTWREEKRNADVMPQAEIKLPQVPSNVSLAGLDEFPGEAEDEKSPQPQVAEVDNTGLPTIPSTVSLANSDEFPGDELSGEEITIKKEASLPEEKAGLPPSETVRSQSVKKNNRLFFSPLTRAFVMVTQDVAQPKSGFCVIL